MMLFAGIAFLLWRLRLDNNRGSIIGSGIMGVLPCIVIIACPFGVVAKSILLLLGLMVLVYVSRRIQESLDVWLALWIVLYYLGTSGNINHVSHIAAFPLLLAVWSISNKSSVVVKGSMVTFVIWALYLFPGNEFDLKIIELRDKYILSSVIAKQIGMTVVVIGSRYIVPVTILVWVMKHAAPRTSLLSMFSIAILPLVFGIGISLTIWTSYTFTEYPWGLFAKLTILFGFSFIIGCAFIIASAYYNFIYPYYLKIRCK